MWICLYTQQVNLDQNRESLQRVCMLYNCSSTCSYIDIKPKHMKWVLPIINPTGVALENKTKNKRGVTNKTFTILLTTWDHFSRGFLRNEDYFVSL